MFHRQIISLVFIVIYLFNHQLPLSSDLLHVSQSSLLPTTATVQFANLNTIPLSFYLTPSRSCFGSTQCLFLSILIALSGDVELNPGPFSLNSMSVLSTSGLSQNLLTILLLLI
jgi:hypothetical protein